MAAIFHFEMLQGAIAPATTSTNIHEPIEELQNVTRNLMEHFKKLSRYNVNGYLPITAYEPPSPVLRGSAEMPESTLTGLQHCLHRRPSYHAQLGRKVLLKPATD